MANKISVIIDVAVDKANTSLKSFRTNIAEAEGAAGKFKAGWAGATDAVKANAGALAMSAGTALVAFGVKSVQAFQDTALAAGKFSDATGIAVEDASRWMEVGGDVGIGADAIQGAIQKMNKALADGKPAFEEYGVEVVRTATGMVDANATFQNALTTIGRIPDPTKRAQAAQQVFGKSYAEVARLMNMSAGDLEAALKGVSNSKVIDQAELKKAREFQAALDTLKDRFEDVMLTVGQRLVPVLESAADGFDMVAGAMEKVADSPLGFIFDGVGGIIDSVKYRAHELADGLGLVDDVTVEFSGDLKDAQKAQQTFGGETATTTDNLRTFSDAANTAAMETKEAAKWTERLAALLGKLDDEAATLALEQQFVDLNTAAEEAYIAAATGSEDAAQKQRDYQAELVATKQRVLEYATEVLGLPADYVTQIAAQLDDGNVAAVESSLNWLARGRTVRINGQIVGADLRNAMEDRSDAPRPGGWDGNPATPWPMAEGGIVMPRPGGTPAILGEGGRPEAVIPLDRAGGMVGGAPVTVNVYPRVMPTDRELMDLIAGVRRRQGSGAV